MKEESKDESTSEESEDEPAQEESQEEDEEEEEEEEDEDDDEPKDPKEELEERQSLPLSRSNCVCSPASFLRLSSPTIRMTAIRHCHETCWAIRKDGILGLLSRIYMQGTFLANVTGHHRMQGVEAVRACQAPLRRVR